jgi:hypothetical protein
MTDDADIIPASEQAQYAALFVPTTGLPGPALLMDRLAVSLLRAQRAHRHAALLIFADIETPARRPLDHAGVTAAMLSSVRPDDTVAQVADRTIVVVCNDVRDSGQMHMIVERVIENSGVVCRVSAILIGDGRGPDPVSLLTRALEEAGVRVGATAR